MVIDLESICLVWLILIFLYLFIRIFRVPDDLSREEKVRREHELERKYLVSLVTGHTIKAKVYKIMLDKYKEK